MTLDLMPDDQDQRISQAFEREEARLRNFVRKRVALPSDVEDILQDVFVELVEAYRLAKPINQVGAWLFRVARNRITDLFRRKRTADSVVDRSVPESAPLSRLEDLLPSPEGGPDAVYARAVLLEELSDALDELSPDQREVFLAHEVEGRGFRDLAAETGLSINTLLSRKRYAVLHLRKHLQTVYDDFTKGGTP